MVVQQVILFFSEERGCQGEPEETCVLIYILLVLQMYEDV